MQEITLKLSIDDANTVLEALGNLPYAKVFNTIAIIQQQAQAQVKPAPDNQVDGPSTPCDAKGDAVVADSTH